VAEEVPRARGADRARPTPSTHPARRRLALSVVRMPWQADENEPPAGADRAADPEVERFVRLHFHHLEDPRDRA